MKKKNPRKDSDIIGRILRDQHKIKEFDSVPRLDRKVFDCEERSSFKGEYNNSLRFIKPSHQTIEEECGCVS
jgi:hypothetical protein